MDAAFTLEVRESGQNIEIHPRGTIDETSALGAPRTLGRPVVIDCGDVRRMNSMGVAAWCRFIADLTSQGPVVLKRMSPMMVTQASMITSFVGRAKVESFFSPWLCPACDHVTEQLHAYRDEIPETVPCPKCSAAMELDWDREAFLEFRKG